MSFVGTISWNDIATIIRTFSIYFFSFFARCLDKPLVQEAGNDLMYAKVFHVENPHLAVLQEGKWKKELRFANTF